MAMLDYFGGENDGFSTGFWIACLTDRLGYLLLSSGSAGATTLDAMYALGGCSVNETSHDLSCEDEAKLGCTWFGSEHGMGSRSRRTFWARPMLRNSKIPKSM